MYSATQIFLISFISFFLLSSPLLAQKVMRFPDGKFYNIEGIDPEKVARDYKEMQELIDAENAKKPKVETKPKSFTKAKCANMVSGAKTDYAAKLMYKYCLRESSSFYNRSKKFKCAKKVLKEENESSVKIIFRECIK